MLIIDDSADPSDLRPGASGSCVIRRMFTDFNLIPKSLATLTTWECLGILEKLNMRQQTQETRCFKRFVWHWLHINQTTKRTKCFLVKIRLYGSRWNTISSDFPPPEKMQSMNSSGALNPLRAPRVFLIWLGGAKKNYINTHKTLTSLMFTAPCPALCNAPPPSSTLLHPPPPPPSLWDRISIVSPFPNS